MEKPKIIVKVSLKAKYLLPAITESIGSILSRFGAEVIFSDKSLSKKPDDKDISLNGLKILFEKKRKNKKI